MWWLDLFPPMAIMFACVATPQYISYYLTKKITGNPVKRKMPNFYYMKMCIRDRNLYKKNNKLPGLESIPD